MSPSDFSKEWTRFNGVIFYKHNLSHNQMPQQISSKSTNVGITEMLALQMSLFQDVSGIHNAIQGKEANSGTPASLYAQQAQNATINTLELMTYFENFLQNRDKKVLKVITQFYNEKRYLAINGRSVNEQSKIYDPEMAKGIDFDIVVTQGTDTPVYRQLIDNTLLELLRGGLIDLKMYLGQTSLPFADKLLQAVTQREEMAAQGQIPESFPPELVNQVNQNADPKSMALIQKALGSRAA
jgi:Rod binding domain-containing protein